MTTQTRSASKAAVLEYDPAFLSTVLEPRIFKSVENLCREAISYSANATPVREAVTRIIVDLRKISQTRFGHDSVDVVALHHLMKRTSSDERERREHIPKIRHDPLWELHQAGRLNEDQVSSARRIQEVWQAFGRYLTIASRSYYSGGGARRKGKVLHPVDVMSDETFELWKHCYKPWYAKASRSVVKSKVGPIASAEIVFKILVEEYHPDQLDRAFKLDNGTTFKVLSEQLDVFSSYGECYGR